METTKRECISFSREYEEEYKFFISQCKGNKSYYICNLLREEKKRQEGENNER